MMQPNAKIPVFPAERSAIPQHRLRAAPIMLAVTLVVLGCGGDESAPEQPVQTTVAAGPAAVPFDTARGWVVTETDSVMLRLELAETDDQRAYGLMDRDELGADEGMIFLYDEQQPGSAGFWMYRTRIPLDIAFLDGAGRIVAIRHMQPCRSADTSRCTEQAREYNPGQPYYAALEVNGGFFAEHGVGPGDRVVVPGRIGG